MATEHYDVIVIGAGIAGASAAYELAAEVRVALLEREDMPGYHATGRSAALYTVAEGDALCRALTVGSRPFLDAPPPGFAEHPLLCPRGALFIGRADQRSSADQLFAASQASDPSVRRLTADEITAQLPIIDPTHTACGHYEPNSMDIDVNALLQGYLKGLRARDGRLITRVEVREVRREADLWQIQAGSVVIAAPVVVNAAGAWVDEIAARAGLPPLGLTPRRRTAITFRPPDDCDVSAWPAVFDVDMQFYFMPDAGLLLASPGDAAASPPCDAQPDDFDVAVAVDRITTATTLDIPRLEHKWAGLRTFATDEAPVAGFDPASDGFFWLAGQGGSGIMTAPALAQATTGLILQDDLPQGLGALGITRERLSPLRLRAPAAA